MASYVNEAIQHLQLLLNPDEILNSVSLIHGNILLNLSFSHLTQQENFNDKVGSALQGRLGDFYQLYLFAITSVHTVKLPPNVVSFKEITDVLKEEGDAISAIRRPRQRDSYWIKNTRFAFPKRREAIEYMLDVLRNIEQLTESFPPPMSLYDNILHLQLCLLPLNDHCTGMRGGPWAVLTVFRILLAAELIQHFSEVSPTTNINVIVDEAVRWWWGRDGQFPENFPRFDNRLNMIEDDYPGVFGKLLRRLGDVGPVENPREWEDPRRI